MNQFGKSTSYLQGRQSVVHSQYCCRPKLNFLGKSTPYFNNYVSKLRYHCTKSTSHFQSRQPYFNVDIIHSRCRHSELFSESQQVGQHSKNPVSVQQPISNDRYCLRSVHILNARLWLNSRTKSISLIWCSLSLNGKGYAYLRVHNRPSARLLYVRQSVLKAKYTLGFWNRSTVLILYKCICIIEKLACEHISKSLF